MRELDLVYDEGVTSYKLFTAYPGVYYSTDGEIMSVMQWAAGNGSTERWRVNNDPSGKSSGFSGSMRPTGKASPASQVIRRILRA